MKFTGVVIIVITILFAVGLRLAETREQRQWATVDDANLPSCSVVTVERVGTKPVRAIVDFECYDLEYREVE